MLFKAREFVTDTTQMIPAPLKDDGPRGPTFILLPRMTEYGSIQIDKGI